MKNKSKCGHKKTVIRGEKICSQGCDCHRAKELEKLNVEEKLGLQYDKEFFNLHGISLTPSGAEGPFIIASINGKETILYKRDIDVLVDALCKASNWCEEGWCPGMS